MKSLKLFFYALLLWFITIGTASAQLPYSWTNGVNPGWTSSNPTNNTLRFQPNYATVSTSDANGAGWYTYNNSQNTTYTSPGSPLFNFTTCATSAYVQVTLTLDINLENNADYLYFEYSVDGGTTWIAPVGSAWTGGAGYITPTYTLPKTVNRFRFRFTSNVGAPIRWYRPNGQWDTYQHNQFQYPVDISNGYFVPPNTIAIYFADILDFDVQCLSYLPIELVSFEGVFDEPAKSNDLTWVTESERNNDHFTIERAAHEADGTLVWHEVTTYPGAGNSTTTLNYIFQDYNYTRDAINYYRISQTDYDGTKEVFDDKLIAIDNRDKNKKVVVKTINLLGQEVKPDTPGVVIYIFEDNTIKRVVNP